MGLWVLLGRRGFSRPRTAAEAGDLLDSAGDQRFYFKSRRFQLFLADQVTLEPGNTGDTGGAALTRRPSIKRYLIKHYTRPWRP